MPSPRFVAMRRAYLARVCETIDQYQRLGFDLRMHSERDGGRLPISLHLDNADAFHLLLELPDEHDEERTDTCA